MKKVTSKWVKEEIDVPFDIDYIKRNYFWSYVTNIDEFLRDIDCLTPGEISEHINEFTKITEENNRRVINEDLEEIVDYIKDENNYRYWKPTKEQLIEAINLYYE